MTTSTTISRDAARALIGKIATLAESESRWLYGEHAMVILPAIPVFDAIREACDPPLTEAEFDALADETAAQ